MHVIECCYSVRKHKKERNFEKENKKRCRPIFFSSKSSNVEKKLEKVTAGDVIFKNSYPELCGFSQPSRVFFFETM